MSKNTDEKNTEEINLVIKDWNLIISVIGVFLIKSNILFIIPLMLLVINFIISYTLNYLKRKECITNKFINFFDYVIFFINLSAMILVSILLSRLLI